MSYSVNEGETLDIVVSLETTGNPDDTEIVVTLTSTDDTAGIKGAAAVLLALHFWQANYQFQECCIILLFK